jgi:hypothetical protein
MRLRCLVCLRWFAGGKRKKKFTVEAGQKKIIFDGSEQFSPPPAAGRSCSVGGGCLVWALVGSGSLAADLTFWMVEKSSPPFRPRKRMRWTVVLIAATSCHCPRPTLLLRMNTELFGCSNLQLFIVVVEFGLDKPVSYLGTSLCHFRPDRTVASTTGLTPRPGSLDIGNRATG